MNPLDNKDFIERFCYMLKSSKAWVKWDIVLDEFMRHTYPDLTPKQRFLYREIIQTKRDVIVDAPYKEVVVRIYIPQKVDPISPFYNNPFLDKRPEKVLIPQMADFDEVSDKFFEMGEDKEVEDVVNELCEKGIITSKMATFYSYNKDGTLRSSKSARVLCIREADGENTIQAMDEIIIAEHKAYFPDVPSEPL